MIGTNGLWSQKKHPIDNIKTKEDPTTLTTHPTIFHNIKLTKREDVRNCVKNSCVYTQLLAKMLHVYAYFGKKTCMYTRLLAKNPHMYVTFGQKSTYVCDFWPKTCVYREDSGKKQAKGQTNKGECQWMNIL